MADTIISSASPEPTATTATPVADSATTAPTPTATPTPVAEPTLTTATPTEYIVGADGAFKEGWMESLPEDLRGEASLANYKSLEGMTKSLISAQKMVGKDKIVVPSEHTTDEEWGEIYNKLGRPESADKYEFSPVENLPEGMPYSQESEQAFKQIAHEAGLTAKQAGMVRDKFNALQIEQFNGVKGEADNLKETAVQALKNEWGNSFDSKISKAKEKLASIDKDGKLEGLFADPKIGNNPDLIKLLVTLTESTMEDSVVEGLNKSVPANAKGELDKIMADPAYFDKESPKHGTLVAEAFKLRQIMNQEQLLLTLSLPWSLGSLFREAPPFSFIFLSNLP